MTLRRSLISLVVAGLTAAPDAVDEAIGEAKRAGYMARAPVQVPGGRLGEVVGYNTQRTGLTTGDRWPVMVKIAEGHPGAGQVYPYTLADLTLMNANGNAPPAVMKSPPPRALAACA
jgi:hypothetical protein